ncbi:MAG TPA: sigma-70 family RNA polymerase sigma factor [Enhygromyxa sp.]|nr:sigma-70 family RNA polymerase sigma factor [Enhygromyxa sp.]
MSEAPKPRLRLVGDPAGSSHSGGPSESGELGPSSFADAFRRHYALVHRMLRVYGVDEALLDDAAQDVFIVVHRRWHDYDGRTAFRSWLVGIVRRVASGYRRAGRRLRGRLERIVPPPSPATVETRLAQREELEWVESFINQLGTRHREVFVLAELEGLTAPEIAETLGIKLNTVYSRLRVARERFRATMARERAREQQGGKRARTRR